MPCLPQLLSLCTILIYSHITQGLPDPLEFLSVRKEMTTSLFLFLFWHLNGAVPSIVWPFLWVNVNLGNWTLIPIGRGGNEPSSISRICWVLAGVKAQPCVTVSMGGGPVPWLRASTDTALLKIHLRYKREDVPEQQSHFVLLIKMGLKSLLVEIYSLHFDAAWELNPHPTVAP